jgi:hypothetical protein
MSSSQVLHLGFIFGISSLMAFFRRHR